MTSVALWVFLGYLTLGARVHLGRGAGFAGFPVLEILFVGTAIVAWLLAGRPRGGIRGGWTVTVGPLFVLLLVLPLAGVVLGTYGVTSLYSWMVVLVPVAVLATVATARERVLPFCHAAVVVHGLYALGQALYRLDLLPSSVWGPMREWDVTVQRSLSEAYVIVGRSTGLFINANTFAMWGVAALVFSYCYLTGLRRQSGVVLSIISVLGSQSRTGALCLAVLLLAWAVHALRDSARFSRATLRVLVFGLPVLLLSFVAGLPQRLLEGGLANRLVSMVEVISDGIESDANLMGRIEAWRVALDYSPTDPRFMFGTLGPPQVQTGHFIDNQFVALYVQGGVLLLAAFVLALLSPLVLRGLGVRRVLPLAVVCAAISLGSLTLTPLFDMQASSLVWVIAGLIVLGAPVPDTADAPSEEASRPRVPLPRGAA